MGGVAIDRLALTDTPDVIAEVLLSFCVCAEEKEKKIVPQLLQTLALELRRCRSLLQWSTTAWGNLLCSADSVALW